MIDTTLLVLWGKLQRVGGEEKNNCIPTTVFLRAKPTFIGRAAEAAPNAEGKASYVLKDYSRNGTYHNGQLVGMKNQVPLQDGDNISLRYKNVDKIIYAFHRVDADDVQQPALPSSNKRKAVDSDDTSATSFVHHKLPKHDNQQVDNTFTQQIMKLQQESQELAQRLKQQSEEMFQLTSEKEKSEHKVKTTEEHIVKLQQEMKDLQERLHCAESQLSATEARNQILQENESKLQQDQKEAKFKLQQNAMEIKDKDAQIEMRIKLLEDVNQALLKEKQHSESCQQHIASLQDAVQALEQRGERMKKANASLQEVVKHKDAHILKLQIMGQQFQQRTEHISSHYSSMMQCYAQIQEHLLAMKVQGKGVEDELEQCQELKTNFADDLVADGEVTFSKRLTSTKSEHDETCHEPASFPFTGILQSPEDGQLAHKRSKKTSDSDEEEEEDSRPQTKAGLRSVQSTPSSSQGSHNLHNKYSTLHHNHHISCTQVAIPEDDEDEGEQTMDVNHHGIDLAATQMPLGDDDDIMDDEAAVGSDQPKTEVVLVEPLRSQSHVMSQIHAPYDNRDIALSQGKKLSQANHALPNTSGIEMPLLSQDSYIRNQQTSNSTTNNNSNSNSAIKSTQGKSLPNTPASVRPSQQNRDAILASPGVSQSHDSSSIVLTGTALKTSLHDDVFITSPKPLLNDSLLQDGSSGHHADEETNDKGDDMQVDVHSYASDMDDDDENTVDVE